MTTDTKTPAPPEAEEEQGSFQEELRRLTEFKKNNVKKDQTPCPACATYVSIKANKCPHCSTDIAANNALVRESLRRLDEINGELDELHDKHIERHKQETAQRPFTERFTGFFADRQFREHMKVLVPAFFLFFVVITALRVMTSGTLFWSVTVASGFIAYTLLSKSKMRRFVTIDLYRATLVVGLLIVMGSAAPQLGTPLWTAPSIPTVEVQRPVVNIRAANSTKSDIIATVQQGEKLNVVEQRGDWYKIETSAGQTGWVFASLVKE